MKRNGFVKVLRFIPMLLVMAAIFFFSAMEGEDSEQTSGFFLKAVVKLVEDISHDGLSAQTMATLHLVIRKLAHFTEYMALGFTIMLAVYYRFTHRKLTLIFPELFAILYAASDEFHQYYVPGRYGTVTDVAIDAAGALVGIIIYYRIKSYFMISKIERKSRKAAKRLRKKAVRRNNKENLAL